MYTASQLAPSYLFICKKTTSSAGFKFTKKIKGHDAERAIDIFKEGYWSNSKCSKSDLREITESYQQGKIYTFFGTSSKAIKN